MICNQCGRPVPDNIKFCPTCGNTLAAGQVPPPPPQPAYYQQPQSQQQPYMQQPPMQQPMMQQQPVSDSRFDGGVAETFVAFLISSLITSVTCGIAFPWALCYLYQFIISHIVIHGRRLRFDGTGGSLFGNWIKWFVLTAITCGIYGFWVYPKMFDWIAKHTHFVDNY